MTAHEYPAPHKLNQVTPHVHWLTPSEATDRPILGAISGERGTLIVDAGNSAAHATLFLNALARVHIAPPTFVALTHWHWDHVFGAQTYGVPVLASLETQRIVAEMARLDWSDEALDRRVAEGSEIEFCRDMMRLELPDRSDLVIRPPDLGFSDELALDLGGVTCRLVLVGGDHSADSIVIYVEEDRVLFLGDCLYEDLYSGPHSYTTGKLFPLLDRLLSFDVEYYMEAHSAEPVLRERLAADAARLKTIGRTVARIGPDREAALAALRGALGEPLDDDQVEAAEAFVAGLLKAASQP